MELPGAEEWLKDNDAKLRQFRLWNLAYKWPAK